MKSDDLHEVNVETLTNEQESTGNRGWGNPLGNRRPIVLFGCRAPEYLQRP